MRLELKLILVVVLFTGLLQAQGTLLSSYTLFNEKNGLNCRNVSGIQQDDEGFFWLATDNDIVRFDGANFIEFKPSGTYFRSAAVSKILKTGNWLFIAYEKGGLLKMDLRDYSFRLVSRQVISDFISKSSDELFWITTEGVINRYANQKITGAVRINGVNGQIQFFNDRIIAKTKGNPIYVLDADKLNLIKKINLDQYANDLTFEKGGGKLFYLKNKIIFEFDQDLNPIRVPAFYDPKSMSVTRLKFINDQLQFYILNRKELWINRNGIQQRILLPGLMNYELKDCLVNDPENFLVSTNQGLLNVRLKTSKNSHIDDNGPHNQSQIRVRRKILETPDSSLILTGYPYTFIFSKDSSLKKLTNSVFSTYDAVVTGNVLYAATEGDGLRKIDISTGRFIIDTTPPLKRYGTYFTLHFNKPDSMLYIGGAGKIYRYDLARGSIREFTLPIPTAIVMSFAFDEKRNRCWIGTKAGLICWTEKTNKFQIVISNKNTTSYEIGDLLIRGKQGELWVGHDHGVDILDLGTGKVIRQLPSYLFTNPRICSLQEDSYARIWMSTFTGITGYNPLTDDFLQLNMTSGLMNLEYNYKSGITRKNGDIVFGGLNGYDIIRPSEYRFNGNTVKGLITGYQRISYDDTVFVKINRTKSEPVNFYSDEEYLRFFLASSDIINNSRYSFEYNFNDAPWLKVKGLPYINLVNLEPGRYKLNIRAFNEFGVPVSFPVTHIISIVPFYRSPAFFITLTALSSTLLLLFIITAIRLRNKEQRLKEQISMDLHDEVGTILTRALHVSKNTNDREGINQLQNYLDDALYSLRVYIHSMNRRTFSLQELNDEINDMMSATFRTEKLKLSFGVEKDLDFKIRGSMFRDIKLCLYEIINNALKHAESTLIEIKISIKDDNLQLLIVDDGRLNNLADIEERGNGIGNLRKRVERNKGNIHFSIRQPDGGLEIELEFPLEKYS